MSQTPDHLVRTQHRRRRYTLLVWTLALALVAAVIALAIHLRWLPPSFVIGHWIFGLSSALALTTWFARARRLDENHVARDLDTEWQLKARVEAAAELAGDRSALAAAQRADAAQRLAGRRLPRALAWHTAQLTLILALIFLFVESTVFTIRIFSKPPAPPPSPEDISASIEWRAPESEIKATSIEEIALAASADTRTGFRSMSLEISVNGEPRLSLPLDAETIKTLAKPGTHAVKLPLYLDETSAAEFDMVSYHLRADRKTRQPAPVVTSPLQFIQIRPAREEVQIGKGQPGQAKMDQLLALVGSLKAAQLALLKQNFLLAHAPIAKTEKAWIDANTTVAVDQKTLATKTAEARAFAIEIEAPTIVVDNLAKVIPLMETASTQIGETQNESATRPQGQALGLITEIEKIIQKIISLRSGGSGPPPSKNPDPFKDDQRYKLPPREKTPAGQLEQLAKEQSEQADKTDPSPSSGDKKTQPSAADQAELARRAEELAKNQQLSEAAQKAAAQAARDAAAAANQLKQGDVSAARAPSQAAAQTLRDAAAAQEKAGRDAARAALEAARRALNEASRDPNAAARAEKIDAVARQLHEAALEQQQSGSAEAARQLEAAARETAKAAEAARKGTDSGPQPGDQPGDNAGTQPGNVSPSDQPGDKPGTKPGDQPGQRPGGDKPGDQPGDKPGAQPTPDPKGDQELTVNLPVAGQQPGEGSGKEPGKEPGSGGTGSGSGSGPGSQPGSGSGSGSVPRLTPVEKAAQAAAAAQVALSDRTEAAGRAARQLQRGSGEGSGSGSGSGPGQGEGEGTSPGGASRPASDIRTAELILGAQLAHAVVNTPESAQHAHTIMTALRRTNNYANVVMTPEVRAAVDHLRLLLAAAVSDDKRDETVRRFNPEDLDPAYREAIESYFERLSREATAKPRP